MRVQMLGLCRFSYLGAAGFQITHDSLSERRAFLYDPERLRRRWFWFEHVVLPAYLAQADPDFTLVVMTGPDLPEPWLSQLHEVAAIIPQMRLELVPPMDAHIDACMAAITPHLDPAADVVGHFRQDDDDAVAVDYIARARADFPALRPLWAKRGRLSLDYGRGLVLLADETGVRVQPQVIYNAVAGLTLFLRPDADRCVMHYPHWRLGLSMPGVMMSGTPMFVRLLHHDNDSGRIGAGYGWTPAPGTDLAALLAKRFRIHLPTLEEAARDFGLPGAPHPHWGR